MRIKNLLVVLVSTLVGLLFWEAGLRLFSHYGPHDAAQPASVPAKPPNVADASRYIRRFAGAGGVDQRWFAEDPPPLPNRTSPSSAITSRYRDFERRGIFGSQAEYVWNNYLVKRDRCNQIGILRPCRTGRRPAPPLPAAIGISSAAASSALRRNMSGTTIW